MTKDHVRVRGRVRVTIADTSKYARGCASKLDGKTGTISAYDPTSFNGQDDKGNPGPAFLVEFDIPAETWHTYGSPHSAFWFPPCDLETLAG